MLPAIHQVYFQISAMVLRHGSLKRDVPFPQYPYAFGTASWKPALPKPEPVVFNRLPPSDARHVLVVSSRSSLMSKALAKHMFQTYV